MRFITSPQFQAFCRQYNASTLGDIHPSLANSDTIRAIIAKQHLLAYPAGQGINGVLYELQKKPELHVGTYSVPSRYLYITYISYFRNIFKKDILMMES